MLGYIYNCVQIFWRNEILFPIQTFAMYVEAETISEAGMASCWFSICTNNSMMCNDEPTLMIVFHVCPGTIIESKDV